MSKLLDFWVGKFKGIVNQPEFHFRDTYNSNQNGHFNLQIITQFYPPDYAATGQLIQELAVQLSKQGMQVRVFTGQPGYAYKEAMAPLKERLGSLFIRRSRICSLWSQRIRGKTVNGIIFCLRSFLYMCKFWQKNNILLVTTAPPFLPLIGYLAHKLLRLPYVCLIYDLYPDAVTELQVLPARHILVRWWNAINLRVWRSAQSIIVLSSTMKERMIAKHPQVADKISVIHNWADPHWIKPIAKQDSWFTHKYELTDKFTVLYSGNLGRCHEINTIVEAARLLQDEPIQFVFIGGGVNRSACIKLVESLGLNNCLFLPYQDKQDLPYSLTACDLALVSIAHGLEGVVAPSKLYGILAAGRPVVAVCEPHSYLRQLLTKAKCGAVFQHNDSINLANFIRFLALNPDLAKKMGQAGRIYLEKHFTPEIIAEQYLQVLTRVRTEAKQENYTTIQEGNVAKT